ncbi:MAG: hypothetical protein H0W68_13510 [Gemmatimonadaceae bacterium]|nr:hypothetical protein [Gemmatimonadaceae bacterium]
MSAGAASMSEIENVTRDISGSLMEIAGAAGRMRTSAAGVSAAAAENVGIVEMAAARIASVSRTAESHAAAAQEVSAATEEQRAATDQMSSAAVAMLEGSRRLLDLVGGLRTDGDDGGVAAG